MNGQVSTRQKVRIDKSYIYVYKPVTIRIMVMLLYPTNSFEYWWSCVLKVLKRWQFDRLFYLYSKLNKILFVMTRPQFLNWNTSRSVRVICKWNTFFTYLLVFQPHRVQVRSVSVTVYKMVTNRVSFTVPTY